MMGGREYVDAKVKDAALQLGAGVLTTIRTSLRRSVGRQCYHPI
jgi:hypothetical protein|eukprot:COSAG02_NODE_4394_length_5412_cov_2.441558_4_plen_44_part_00